MKKIFLVVFITIQYFSVPVKIYAQNVGISNDGSLPNPRSLLDLKSTDKGLLLPRMTSSQRLAIPTQGSDAGLIVFDSEKQSLYIFNGVKWMPVSFNSENDIGPVNHAVSDGASEEFFGNAVAIDGDYAVVGAFGDHIGTNWQQGSAYIFHRTPTGWVQQAKLIAPDGGGHDVFGIDVDISGDYVVVGAFNAAVNGNTQQGAAYVFVRNGNTWTQQAKLVASDGAANDFFGRVAISGNTIVVGATGDDVLFSSNQGSIYVFTRNGSNWTQVTKLIANDGDSNDELGASIDIHGSYIVAGAAQHDLNGINYAGAVYTYRYINGVWAFQQKITSATAAEGDFYGRSVAVHNNTLAIGVPGKDVNGQLNQGAFHIYSLNGNNVWANTGFIGDLPGDVGDKLGSSVDVRDNIVLVGAPNSQANDFAETGTVYVYERIPGTGTWRYKRRINNTEPQVMQEFGAACAVDISGNYIIGSPARDGYTGLVSFGKIDY